ncbi:Ankyrin repeats (3 copies) [Popillia japonica]|uniref:Ankyrin repeats (3 copies) n=1 Tax=Popillia japonica TaxID=7064 RepID=A0AAW1JBR1_POPJA
MQLCGYFNQTTNAVDVASRHPSTATHRKMVMTKSAGIHQHQSSVKEIMVPSPGRLMSRRIPELPSLRYGSLGAKSAVSGPLRVSNHYRSETLPRTNSKKVKNVYRDEVSSCKPSRPARRVRFTLPSSDGDTGRSDAEFIPATTIATPTANLTVKRTTAGDSNYPKTRVTPISTRSDSKQGNHHYNNTTIQNNRSQIGYRHSTASSSAFFGETPQFKIIAARSDTGTVPLPLPLSSERIPFVTTANYNNHDRHYYEQHLHKLQQEQEERDLEDTVGVFVPVTASPAVRTRVHPTGKYIRGTLSPTANTAAHAAPTSPGGQLLLRAARDAEDGLLRDVLRRAQLVGITDSDLNATDNSGRTALSYIASNGSVETLDQILQLPNLDPNISDNEGNTPLHFAAQAGQVECLNCMLTRCRGIEIDARNNLGFTPLMKAALQGRNKCAKLLLFADEQKIEKVSLWKQWKNYFKGRRKEDGKKSCNVVTC